MNALHLTDENKSDLRAVVTAIGLVERFKQPQFTDVKWTDYSTGMGATHAELQAVMRRAFVPQLVMQIHSTSPLFKALIKKGVP